MKKLFLVLFTSLTFLFLISPIVKADGLCIDPSITALKVNPPITDVPSFINSNSGGLVPCGQTITNGTLVCACQLAHFGVMGAKIYVFSIKFIAIPLVALLIVIGGLIMLISGGNPGMISKGKNMIIYTLIALAIILGSYLIIDVVLRAIGFVLPWNIIPGL